MAAIERRVGRHHLAFYRGWIQGVDLRVIADLYLETGLDLRYAKSTALWLKDTISQAALRHGKRQDARLLKLHIGVLQTNDASNFPTLEDFRDQHDPEGFYREDELIKIYLAEFPQAVDKKRNQRRRLIERQLKAMSWIEELLATDPVPEDLVSAWFDKPISNKLILAKIATIGELCSTIANHGNRWWTKIPRLGEKGAARIVDWLRGYEASIGPIPTHALVPARSLNLPEAMKERSGTATGVVPLEACVIPEQFDGTRGKNRASGTSRISATTDLQAVNIWLETKNGSPNTQRAYKKEAERFMLWAVIERRKSLSDMDVEDCTAYRNWLSMLGRTDATEWPFTIEQCEWIGKRNTPRHSPAWKPFDGPLSVNSVKHAITVVSSMCEWMVKIQHLAFNPWDVVGKKVSIADEAPADIELTRVFSEAQWQYMLDYLSQMPDSKNAQRLKFALPFAYATGMRISELVSAQTGLIYSMPLRDSIEPRWMIKVHGKGGKWRAVPLPASTLQALGEYLRSRGLPPDPADNKSDTPLIANVDGYASISDSALYKIVRTFFQEVALELRAAGNRLAAKEFERGSVHWLRHTRGSHLGNAGVPANLIQKLLGHASLATTSIYTESDEERLWREISEQEQACAC